MSRPIRHVPWLPLPAASYQPSGRVLSLVERAVLGVFLDDWARHSAAQLRAGMPDLAAAVGVSLRAARAAVRSLEAAGLLAVERSSGGRNRWATYRLTLPETRQHVPGIRARNAARRAGYPAPKPGTETRHDVPGHTERDPETVRAPLTGARSETWDAWVDDPEVPHG